jgi:hypothetical protein
LGDDLRTLLIETNSKFQLFWYCCLNLIFYRYKNCDTPEKQWVKVQIAKKEKALQAIRARPDAGEKLGRDLVLDIEMRGCYKRPLKMQRKY